MATTANKRISVRIDDNTSAKMNYLISSLNDNLESNSTSALIKFLIDSKFNEISMASDNFGNSINFDTNQLLKIDYIFEYLELIIKVDPNIKQLFLDSNNNEKEEVIDRYINASSRFRKYIERKVDIKVDENE